MAKTEIRFTFHKPIGERGIGKAIVLWTGFLGLFYNWKVLKYNYSHVEIWIPDGYMPDGYGIFEALDGNQVYAYFGECFSSTTRGGWKGVRFAPAAEVVGKHPGRWSYIECEIDLERLEVAIEEAKKLIGAEYDFLGIFGFLNPLPIQDKKKWYCSEICDWFRVLCGIPPERQRRISPRRLAYLLSDQWGEPKEL